MLYTHTSFLVLRWHRIHVRHDLGTIQKSLADVLFSRELYSEDGTSVVYGAGQIFVQGPAEEDIPYAISLAALSTPDELHQRRISEEGSSEGVIESGQWATLTTEDEVSLRI